MQAVDDHLDENLHLSTVNHTVASADPDYDGIYAASVVVSITDNDKAGVSIFESGVNTEVTEGAAGDTYMVVLDTQPSATVTVAVSSDPSQLTISPTSLTFNASSWSNAQTVTVWAVDDYLDEGSHLQVVSHAATSGDPAYDGVSVAAVVVFVIDNDETTYAEIVAISNLTAGVRFIFNSESNHYYRAEHCSNLLTVAEWGILTNNVLGHGNPLSVSDPTAMPVRFYRVRARPSLWPAP